MVLGLSGPECIAVELRRGESLGDFDRAVALYGEAEPLWRSLSESTRTVWSLVGLGHMAWRQGAYDRSEALFEEAMALGQAIGFAWGAAQALHALAGMDLARGDHRRAAARYAESLALAQAQGDELTMVDCLARLATLAYPLGKAERAARLCGITEALGEALGVPLMPATRAEYDRVMTAVRADLGAAAFAAASAAGRVLPLEEGTAEAMAIAVGTMAGGALVGSRPA